MTDEAQFYFDLLPEVGPGSILVFHDVDDPDGMFYQEIMRHYLGLARASGKYENGTPAAVVVPLVVMLYGEGTLATANEDEMRAAGWVRA